MSASQVATQLVNQLIKKEATQYVSQSLGQLVSQYFFDEGDISRATTKIMDSEPGSHVLSQQVSQTVTK